MRTFHIWVKNKKTNEVKCKLVEVNNFANAASEGYVFVHTLREETYDHWRIMSISDARFSHDPKVPMV